MLLTRSEFFSLLILAVTRYFAQEADPESRPADITPGLLKPSYDFIVVGAGAAGSVVGSRLSENENWNVLVIEAGGSENLMTDVPILGSYTNLGTTSHRWNYTSVPQKNACIAYGGCNYYMGRIMGGSSSVGISLYSRGNKDDYNKWAEFTGSQQWSYNNVLNYFIKMENASSTNLSEKYHGRNGPQSVQLPWYKTPLNHILLQASQEIGFNIVDNNAESQIGVAEAQLMMRGPTRASASTSYLNPARFRPNLDISQNSFVTKLTFDETNKTVTGVYFERNNEIYYVKANKEVILSAGAFNTPALLMLSGIGHKEHLESLNIPVISNLPIGDNLQDNLAAASFFTFNNPITLNDNLLFTNQSIIDYAVNRNGSLTTTTMETVIYVNVTDRTNPIPNILMMFHNYRDNLDFIPDPSLPYIFNCVIDILSAKSRGTVRLRSNNPYDAPMINPNFFSAQSDYEIMALGFKSFLNIMKTSTMRKYKPNVYFGTFQPNCALHGNNEDEYIECVLRQYSSPDYHPSGTCRMGRPDQNTTVVDPNLLVLGFNNLRVIDASIMPTLVSGNSCAATMMIGELGSDIIKSKWN